MTIRRTPHASDFSPASRPAFRLARELARTLRARLILFHAYELLTLVVAEGPVPLRVIQDAIASTRRCHAARSAEIRVAQAQLVGWLGGLFHGIQAALWAQQMQARAQLEEMRRRGLPSGVPGQTPPGHYL